MNDLLNPYIAGAPIVEADMFFGRKDVFGWIERSLRGKYVDHTLVIHGQRRVGKTSVLKQIPNFLPDEYIQVFFDLQGRTNTTLDRFLWWLGREIHRTLKDRTYAPISPPDRSKFAEDPETLFTDFLPEVQAALDKQVLLLTFDEFDTLNQPTIQESLARPLIQILRRMMELEDLSFIFSIGSSGQKLENMRSTYTDFFKSALYKKISFLEEGDCVELITRPVEGVLDYHPEAVQRIYGVTAGHPYFTQLVCHELFSICQKSGVREIQRADVDAVLGSVIERGTVNLKYVWDEADDLEKWTLACLARSPECSDPSLLAQTLREQRVRFSETDLTAALVHLREKDILTMDNHFVVELMRLWLRQNRPLERAREELVEVSPIANRYIEIGEEYWEGGQREAALESFKQALEVDPGNVKARVSVGVLLLESREYESAASAFEGALELDGEDVAALRGFCQAQMALGDQARDGGDIERAIVHYQAVLAINPEHTAARGRLADLYSRRAEAEIGAGEDEAALLTFQAALGFTPEDQELGARVEQVMAEKRAKAVSSLTGRAEAAQAKGDWGTAIASLQDALTLTGEDVALEKKLAEVRAGQRAHLLATLPDQARKLEASEDWAGAIRVWVEYLALHPDDLEEPEEALAHAQLMRTVSSRYTQARAALEQKDYPQAIDLLQQVIQADPGYKDSSRLLASAVGASRRKKVSLRRWAWFALPLMVVLTTAGVYFSLNEWGQLPAITFQRAMETQTSPPPTPIPEWVAGFAEPLLAEIEGLPPHFEDDFSSIKDTWSVPAARAPNEHKAWADSALQLIGNDPYVHLNVDSTDIIVQFQFKPVRLSGGIFQIFITKDQYINLDLGGDKTFEIKHSDAATDTWYSSSDNTWPGMTILRELTVVLQDGKLAVYMDGQPLNAASKFNVGEIDFNFGVAYGNSIVEVDNFRYWDLNALEGEPITQVTPTVTPEGVSEQITPWDPNFTQPILDEITGRPPDFEDDFSTSREWQNQYGISVEQAGSYEAGRYLLSVSGDEVNQKLPILSQDFVLELEFLSGFSFSGEDTVFALTMRGDSSGDHYRFEIDPRDNAYRMIRSLSTGEDVILDEGELPEMEQGASTALQVLASDDQMVFYWNDKPLTWISDSEMSGVENGFSLAAPNGSATLYIDDLKFWNLEDIDIEPYSPTSTPEVEATTIASGETDICTVKSPILLKLEPDPNATTGRGGPVEAGAPIRVIETTTGTDGQSWYNIGYEHQIYLGLSGWVPASALTNACFQEPPADEDTSNLLYKKQIFPGGITSLDWSDKRDAIAVAGRENNVSILNGSTGSLSQKKSDNEANIVSVAWKEHRHTLATGRDDGVVRTDDTLGELNTLAGKGEITAIKSAHQQPITINEEWNEPLLAFATDEGNLAVWWVQNTGGLVAQIQASSGPIYALDFKPDNTQLLAVSEEDGVQVWDTSTWGRLRRMKYMSKSAAWSPDGNYIVLEDHSLTLTPSSAPILEIIGTGGTVSRTELPGVVNKVAWSPDGDVIATAGQDGTVRLWSGFVGQSEMVPLKEIQTFTLDAEVTDIVWSLNGDVLVAGDVNGYVWGWQIP